MHLSLSQAEYPALYGSPRNSNVRGALIRGSIPVCGTFWSDCDAHEHSKTTGKSLNSVFIISVLPSNQPQSRPAVTSFLPRTNPSRDCRTFPQAAIWKQIGGDFTSFSKNSQKFFSGICYKKFLPLDISPS